MRNNEEYKYDWICIGGNGEPLPLSKVGPAKEPKVYAEINESDASHMMHTGEFNIIKSVPYDNKCVGVSAYNFSENVGLILHSIYILEEYRGKGVLKKELDDAKLIMDKLKLNGDILIDFPSRNLMKSLVNNGLAFFDGDWIISLDYPLTFPLDEAEKKYVKSHFYNFKFGKTFAHVPIGDNQVDFRYTAMHDLDAQYYLKDLRRLMQLNDSFNLEHLFSEYEHLYEKYIK